MKHIGSLARKMRMMNSFRFRCLIFSLHLCLAIRLSSGQSVKGGSFLQSQPAAAPPLQAFPSPVANFNHRQQQQQQFHQRSFQNDQQQQFGVRLNKPAVSHPDNYMQYGVGAIEPRPILIPQGQRHPSPVGFEQQQIQQNVGLGQNGTAFYAARDDNVVDVHDGGQQQLNQQQNTSGDQNQQNWSKYMQKYPEGRNLVVQNSAQNGRPMFSVEPRPSQIIPHPHVAPVVAAPSGGIGPNMVQFRSFVGGGTTPLMYQNIVPIPIQQQPIVDGPVGVGHAVHQSSPSTNNTITGSGNERFNYIELPRNSQQQPSHHQVNRFNFYESKDGVVVAHRPNNVQQQQQQVDQQQQQIPVVQQYQEIPGQIPVAPLPHQQPSPSNITGRYFSGSGPGPLNYGVQQHRYQIPVHQVGPVPIGHYHHQVPQQIVAGSPAIVHRVVPASSAGHQYVGQVPLVSYQPYEIPTQLVSTSRFIQPSQGGGPEARIDVGRLVGTPVVKAGLIDAIRFPLHGRYVKPHIAPPTTVQYQPQTQHRQYTHAVQQPDYLMSQARPLVAHQQIHTPVFLSNTAHTAHSDYRYSLTPQAGGASIAQAQQQQPLIPPTHLTHGGPRPFNPRVSVVQQHQQRPELPPVNNQYYRIPIETIRTTTNNNRIPVDKPVTNFVIAPYMHPYRFPSTIQQQQPRPMYYGIGDDQTNSDQSQQSHGRPGPVVTIEEVPRNDANNQDQDQDQGSVNFNAAGQQLSSTINDHHQRFGQSSHVEYDENSSEPETSRQPTDGARSEQPQLRPQPQPQQQQQQQFNEGWISQEPVQQQQYYSDEDLRGVALNINGPQQMKKKK